LESRERRRIMTGKADFTPEEWQLVAEGPPTAGLAVATAKRGGTFRESFALAKAYTEARGDHGESQLLDELVSERPRVKHERAHSPGELTEQTLQLLRDAVALVRAKATPEELDDYGSFILNVANRVANAHKEGDVAVAPEEKAVIEAISSILE
jgi:hypothetical protein